jgi:hypothetical protein
MGVRQGPSTQELHLMDALPPILALNWMTLRQVLTFTPSSPQER